MNQSIVRWGILSTARIGTQKVIPAMSGVADAQVTSIASRDLTRATSAATDLGIPTAFGSYEELLESSNVDAVYNPLPNHLHVDWTIQALEAGKHVLCEKPIGLNANDAQRLIDACGRFPELKVMEAFMYRHHPQWQEVRQRVEQQTIGTLRAAQFTFCYCNTDASDIRNRVDAGGGALMDIGCYPISIARWLFRRQPNRVIGAFEISPELGTDILTSGMLDFGSGTASYTCSTQLPRHQRAVILGTAGRIELPWPFNPDPESPATIMETIGDEASTMEFARCNQYGLQVERMNSAILRHRPVPTPLTDALEYMQVIDALVASRQTGSWIDL